MVLNIHATIQHQNGRLITRIGNPTDHRLEGGFMPYKAAREQQQMELTLWSRQPLNHLEIDEVSIQVLQSIGMVAGV